MYRVLILSYNNNSKTRRACWELNVVRSWDVCCVKSLELFKLLTSPKSKCRLGMFRITDLCIVYPEAGFPSCINVKSQMFIS